MVSDGFADRFLDSTYADDEPVHVFISDGGDRWIPERIWSRLVNLGRAYETHLLPLLPASPEPQFLNDQQVANLIDEVEFVGSIISDPLLIASIADLLPLLAEARHHKALVIQGA